MPNMRGMNKELIKKLEYLIDQDGLPKKVSELFIECLQNIDNPSEYPIPNKEHDNVMSVFWALLMTIESRIDRKKDVMDMHMVSQAYNLLNRIGFTNERPRFEEKKKG